MSQQPITYQQVVDACQSLKQTGQKPSVRAIHQQVGGSFSTIAAFFRQWQEQIAKMDADAHALSLALKQSLFNEFEAIQKRTQARLSQQLQQLREANKESETLLADYEQQLQQGRQVLSQAQENHQTTRIELEKQNAMLLASNQHAKERIAQLEKNLEELRQSCKQFEIQAAVNLTRYESIAETSAKSKIEDMAEEQ